MKKSLLLLIGFIMIMAPTFLTANGGSEENGAAASDGVNKYTIFLKGAYVNYPSDGEPGKSLVLEKAAQAGITNFDYEVVQAAGDEYMTKFNVMIASKELPDMATKMNVNDLPRVVDTGALIPLTDYVPQMPAYSSMVDPLDLANLSIDGEVYGLPNVRLLGPLSGKNTAGLLIREDWLNNLGLDYPTTVDELHDVFMAFTYGDPDGNGKDDTYGLGGYDKQFFRFLFGAYGVYMGDDKTTTSWMERDGEIVHSTTVPETKEVLALLQKWYVEDKIIDPDKFIIQNKQAKEKFTNGQIGAYENSLWWAQDHRNAWEDMNATDNDVKIINAVKGPEGDSGYALGGPFGEGLVITTAAKEKNLDQLISFVDWIVDGDVDKGGFMTITYGEPGVDYDWNRDTDVISMINGSEGYDILYSKGLSNPMRWIAVVDRRWMTMEEQIDDMVTLNAEGNTQGSANYKITDGMKDFPDTFQKLWAEYFVKIVTGEYDVDKWDEYVEKFNKQGGKMVTDEVNALN